MAKAIRVASRLKAQVRNRLAPNVRRRISFAYLRGQGIEIGALHSPLPVSRHTQVCYVDRLRLPDLRAHYPELAKLKLVEPSIIDDGETLLKVASASLDFVIANHVVEHCQDPIGALQNWLRVLKPEGVLYMAVPDKRHTFDRDRPLTPLQHLLDDHARGPHLSRAAHFEEWARLVNKVPESQVAAHIADLTAMDYSIHFHVWTPEEFLKMLLHCRHCLDLPLEIELMQRNGIEFILMLRKTQTP